MVIMVGKFIDLMGLGGDNQQTWWIYIIPTYGHASRGEMEKTIDITI